MSDRKLLSTLEEIGLTEKEAKVYYAALQLGPSSVLQISRSAGVKRSTVYSILESLQEKRLVKKAVYGVKEFFEAESPEHLEALLNQRRNSFQDILPQLSALYQLQGEESVVKYYEGIDRVKLLYLDMIHSVRIGEDYLVLSGIDMWRKHRPDFFDEFVKKRGAMDICVKQILEPSEFARFRQGKGRQPNEHTKLLPPKTKLTTNLVIIPSQVLIHQITEPQMAMVIQNKHIIRMHREMFELIWAGL